MPRRHRSHSMDLERQVVAEYNAGETLHGLSRRHDVCRNLIRVWIAKADAGEFNDDIAAAELLATCEARIAALERLVGRQAPELAFVKGGGLLRTLADKRADIRDRRPRGVSVRRGCDLMGVARPGKDAAPAAADADAALVAEMRAITDVRECYGYRRVGAELRRPSSLVNAKKVRRLVKLHDLNPRRRRRFTKTTGSDHDGPIYPLVARGFETHAPAQLRVGDITLVAIAAGFVHVAIVLDAWSRRVLALFHRPPHRRTPRGRRLRARHRPATPAARLRHAYGPRVAVRIEGAQGTRVRARRHRLDEPARKPLRQPSG